MMKWYCIQFYTFAGDRSKKYKHTQYEYTDDLEQACAVAVAHKLYAYPGEQYLYEVNHVGEQSVPVLIRGLREATTEQIRDELRRRGWKVTSP